MANVFDMIDTWNAAGTTFTAIKMNVTDTASAAGSLLMDLQVGGASKFSVGKGAGAYFSSNLLELRNGTNAQALQVFNTYTDASNYERANIAWNANVLEIATAKAGTGVDRKLLLQGAGVFGTSKLELESITGMNGARFTHIPASAGTDLVDFALVPGAAGQVNMRVEGRAGSKLAGSADPEFQFMTGGTVRAVLSDAGFQLQSGHIRFGTDNSSDIGASGANRPRDVHIARDLKVAGRTHVSVVATASLPAAGAAEDGRVLIEDAAAGDRNLIIYAAGQRFRIDGGTAF